MVTLDRRTIIAFFATTGVAGTLLPGRVVGADPAGHANITMEMVREAARLAGLNWTDEECQELLDRCPVFSPR